ncbi:MAG: type II secretion system protein GspD [Phycisphaerales bacterium]
MRQRNQSSTRPIARATAIALFCLAGTDACLAQFATPKSALNAPAGQPGNPGQPDRFAPNLEGNVKIDDTGIVDINVNDEDLANVLQMLSIQSQKNIITSKNVSATVTANLYGVTFFEAMDAILHVNGFGWVERGNFIYVYTLEELEKIEQAQRQKVSKVLKLNYLNSIDAAEFVKALLSEQGQIKTNGKTAAFPTTTATPVGADNFANDSTMVVTDFEENVAEIEKLVKELDTRPVSVLVDATILQTTLNEENAFGVDFSVIADLSFGDFVDLGGPLKAVDGLLGGSSTGSGGDPLPGDDRGATLGSTPGNTAGPGTFKAGIVWNDVAAFIRLLDEVSDTQIISRPNILTLNRQPARVLVGRKVGYLNTTSTDTSTTQSVEFLDTGTQLYLRPFVSTDGMIRMELKPQVSEAVIRTVTDAGGAAVTIPDEITNELTTNVMVRDGQTVVLGGLFRESTSAARRQVPWLGDVPIIGIPFRGHEDEIQRSEIMFMITPNIANDIVMGEAAARGTAFVTRVITGAREGLLPWSREKQTGQRLVMAEDLAREGKTSAALGMVQRALALNPFQPDAIALRERLMNKKAVWPSRHMLDEILHGEMQKRLDSYQPVVQRGAKSSPAKATASAAGAPISAKPVDTRPVPHPFPTEPVWSPTFTDADTDGMNADRSTVNVPERFDNANEPAFRSPTRSEPPSWRNDEQPVQSNEPPSRSFSVMSGVKALWAAIRGQSAPAATVSRADAR